MTNHGGRFQAQGSDIDSRKMGGESKAWDLQNEPDKEDGVNRVEALSEQCHPRERQARATEFERAQKFVARTHYDVAAAGKPLIKSLYCRGAKFPDMRVDIEIRRGCAWKP